jgi:hypothetical protein
MNLEETISQHPCPIIKAKLMEHASHIKPLTNSMYFIAMAILNQRETSEGCNFWYAVAKHNAATYETIKHLDRSYYVNPQHANHVKPTAIWRKIDKDNLPVGIVATTNRNVSNPVFYVGIFHKDRDGFYLNIVGGGVVSELTHYIQLSDLLNLPIEA